MPSFRIDGFGGSIPALDPRLIPDNMAAVAVNTDLATGRIRPFSPPKLLTSFESGPYEAAVSLTNPSDPSVWWWLPLRSSNGRAFRSPLSNDAFGRIIRLDNNAPGNPARLQQNTYARIQSGDPWYYLGVVPPDISPTVTAIGGSGPATARVYVYTYVNVFGEEGPPSPTSQVVNGFQDSSWEVSGFLAPVDAADYGLTTIRIYRTISGSSGTQYFKVSDVPISTTTYTDTTTDTDLALLGIVLPSLFWLPPEPMEGIVLMPNGFFAGWRGRSVFFSEPYRPWAWPPVYNISVPDDIIGGAATSNALVLATSSRTVVMAGSRPESISMERSDFVEPCTSPQTVVAAPEGVYYASSSGVILVSTGGVINMTQRVIDPAVWTNVYSKNIRALAVTPTYIIWLLADGSIFALDKADSRRAVVRLSVSIRPSMLWQHQLDGRIVCMAGDAVYRLLESDAGGVCGWLSKEFFFTRPANIGSVILHGDGHVDADKLPLLTKLSFVDAWQQSSSLLNYSSLNAFMLGHPSNMSTPTLGPLNNIDDPPLPTPTAEFLSSPAVDAADLSGLGLPAIYDNCLVVYADGKEIWRRSVTPGKMYKLPSGIKAVTWQFAIITRRSVFAVELGETGRALSRS